MTTTPRTAAARNELAAVLLDMDGTLVDTEPYWIEAEYKLVAEFGGTWNDEHAHALVGNALITSAEYLRDVGGVRLDPPVIVERLLDEVVVAAVREMPWRPGALDLLAALGAAGVPAALVTMSYARLAQTLVDRLPAAAFAAVVTGDQVRVGKPDPEAYLTAAARLGADPARCVAIEDSPTGIRSARAAGCAVVGVPHRVPLSTEPGVVLVPGLEQVTVDGLAALLPS